MTLKELSIIFASFIVCVFSFPTGLSMYYFNYIPGYALIPFVVVSLGTMFFLLWYVFVWKIGGMR